MFNEFFCYRTQVSYANRSEQSFAFCNDVVLFGDLSLNFLFPTRNKIRKLLSNVYFDRGVFLSLSSDVWWLRLNNQLDDKVVFNQFFNNKKMIGKWSKFIGCVRSLVFPVAAVSRTG